MVAIRRPALRATGTFRAVCTRSLYDIALSRNRHSADLPERVEAGLQTRLKFGPVLYLVNKVQEVYRLQGVNINDNFLLPQRSSEVLGLHPSSKGCASGHPRVQLG